MKKLQKILIILAVTGLIWQFSFGKVQTASAAEKTESPKETLDVEDGQDVENVQEPGDAGAEEENKDEDSGVSLPIVEDVKPQPEPSLPEIKGVVTSPQVQNVRPKNSVNPQSQNPAVSLSVSPGDVVINELMWMGSSASGSDEWVELKNITNSTIDFSVNNWSIYKNDSLMLVIDSGTLDPNSYFLISNYDADSASSVLDVTPDLVKTAISLSNSGAQYKLYDAADNAGSLIDAADDGTGAPLAGDNTNKYSMERNSTSGNGTLAANWHTANKSVNFDLGAFEKGTPKAANSQTPNFISVVSNKTIYKNGNIIVVTATLNQNNYQVSADFSLLDDQYTLGDEIVVNNNNTYTISYTISNSNSLSDASNIIIEVTADDEINPLPVISSSLTVDLDNTVPQTPQNLRVVTGEGFVYLSWNLVLDAVHYEIWRSGSFVLLGTTIDTFYRDENVIGGRNYDYKIIAVDAVGNKSVAAEISATPPVIIIAPDITPILTYGPASVTQTQPQIAAAVVEKEAIEETEKTPVEEEIEEPGEVKGEETEEEEVPTNWPLIIGVMLAGLVVIFWVYYWYVSWKESKTKTRKRK